MKKGKLVLIISLVGILIIIGGGVMHLYNEHKQEELKRNRKYEVSLVKELKNSYEGIEEIEISNPKYVSPPGAWSCKITIIFNNGEHIHYGLSHYLDDKVNYEGRMTYRQSDFLEAKKGNTKAKVKVTYSNGAKGEQ